MKARVRCATAADRAQASARVCETARRQHWSAEQKHEWLARFTRRLGLDWEDFLHRRVLALMHPEEIGSLDPAIADVQLHTHRHPALPWLAEAGVISAVTCVPGQASRRHPPLLLLRFVDTGTTSEVEFEGWAPGPRHFIGRPRVNVAR